MFAGCDCSRDCGGRALAVVDRSGLLWLEGFVVESRGWVGWSGIGGYGVVRIDGDPVLGAGSDGRVPQVPGGDEWFR